MDSTRHYKSCFATILIILFLENITFAKQPIQLLVRGDDMGVTYDVTLAIIIAHKEGIVTSASIMPTSAYFEEAVRLCKANPTLAAGIHITLLGTKERPVLSPETVPSIVTPEGFFYETTEQLNNANPKTEEMEKKSEHRLEKLELVDCILSILIATGEVMKLPMRLLSNYVMNSSSFLVGIMMDLCMVINV